MVNKDETTYTRECNKETYVTQKNDMLPEAAQEDTSAPNWKISSKDVDDQSSHQLWETNTEPDNSDNGK